jgi:SAM-dependent methyltransferase
VSEPTQEVSFASMSVQEAADSHLRFAVQVQTRQDTQVNRYPEIFAAVGNLTRSRHNGDFTVLSYGCSTGEEVRTLRQLYFPRCRIVGLDVSAEAIARARQNSDDLQNVAFDMGTDLNLENYGPYDVIFAMSVFCRWPESGSMNSILTLFPFEHFEERLHVLDKSLRPGGCLVLVNANYNFFDSTVSRNYDLIMSPNIKSNGFVTHFSRSSTVAPVAATDCIYLKRSQNEPPGTARSIRVLDEVGMFMGSIGLSG